MMEYPGMRQNSADIILIPRGLAGGGGGTLVHAIILCLSGTEGPPPWMEALPRISRLA